MFNIYDEILFSSKIPTYVSIASIERNHIDENSKSPINQFQNKKKII